MHWIGLAILLNRWADFEFCDLGGFHSSAMVHSLLMSWLFRGFLSDGKFQGGDPYFCEVLCFGLFLQILFNKLPLYGFVE